MEAANNCLRVCILTFATPACFAVTTLVVEAANNCLRVRGLCRCIWRDLRSVNNLQMNVIANATHKLSLSNAEIVVQSSKRPTPLRQSVLNDITHIIQHDCKNEVLQDWSDFNFPDMYGDKMDAYEADLSAHDDPPSNGSLPEEDQVSVLSAEDTDKFGFVPPPHNHPLMFTSYQKWTIALLKLLAGQHECT